MRSNLASLILPQSSATVKRYFAKKENIVIIKEILNYKGEGYE